MSGGLGRRRATITAGEALKTGRAKLTTRFQLDSNLHPSLLELEDGLAHVHESPKEHGFVQLIVRRPAVDQREVIDEGVLDVTDGLAGDSWSSRRSKQTPDGSPHPEMQINIMNARVANLVARHRARWPLAGDQLFVDLDLSADNLPPGTRLAAGTAVLEVSAEPHTGCDKFVARFGLDAVKFVNSAKGRRLNLRGINARVIQSGVVRTGDVIAKVRAS
jgi:hypothetical protein